ncbi:MAG: radical SAM protein [Nitrospinae bacterium]|nr:radical SAM protein [Nitrospinota bacterium]
MKIVLANCVGIDGAGWYIIPYPSRWTTSAKGHSDAFTYYPRDLGYLSSLLKRDTGHEIKLVDACLTRMDKEDYAKLIAGEKPDWLLMESSTRTINEDMWVARAVKAATGAKVAMTGQHPTTYPRSVEGVCDLVIKGEYLKPALEFFRNGAKTPASGVIEFDRGNLIDVDELPLPEDGDISRLAYAMKGDPICRYREAQVYASRGCPYRCVYCVACHTYYGGPDYRARNADSVVAELDMLFTKYPSLEGAFFDDEIHNANIARTKKLARAITAAGLDGKRYDAMCAYQNFDREALELMKRAGYYQVRVGVETASDTVAQGLQLGAKYRPDKLNSFLDTAKEIGLGVYATFTLGGPGATAEEDGKTVKLMRQLIESDLISDCQVSICTPQPGTPFYDWALEAGALVDRGWEDFDGGVSSVIDLPGYTGGQIESVRLDALHAYDEARKTRDGRVFYDNWDKSVKTAGIAPKRPLLFRSSRDWHIEMCLNAVRQSWTEAEVGFLCHEGHRAGFENNRPWLKILPYGREGFLSVDGLDGSLLDNIARFAPDTAFIPSNSYHCRGYGNVLEVAERLSIRDVYFINSAGEIIPARRSQAR